MISIRKYPSLFKCPRVPNVSNSAVQLLIQESIAAIGTLSDAITRDNWIERRQVSRIVNPPAVYLPLHPPRSIRRLVSGSYSFFTV